MTNINSFSDNLDLGKLQNINIESVATENDINWYMITFWYCDGGSKTVVCSREDLIHLSFELKKSLTYSFSSKSK